MKIGTVEMAESPDEKKSTGSTSRRPTTAPGNRGNGPNDDGGDGGDDGYGKIGKPEPEVPNSADSLNKSRILMWFLLLVVLMTFGGLIGAYVVISTNAALEWRPFDLPVQVWVSTVLILLSSLTFDLGRRSLEGRRFLWSKRWFLVTTVLGASFISSQLLAWMALVNRGLYMSGNPYAGFFYILTAVHAVHVIGGICALGYTLLRTWAPSVSERDHQKKVTDATVTGWYWHTMDVLWLVLLFLLGFWK